MGIHSFQNLPIRFSSRAQIPSSYCPHRSSHKEYTNQSCGWLIFISFAFPLKNRGEGGEQGSDSETASDDDDDDEDGELGNRVQCSPS